MSEARSIDDISATLGELRAYIHEHRHTANNLSQKFDALDAHVGRRIEASEVRITASIAQLKSEHSNDIAKLAARLAILEATDLRRDGASNALAAVIKSPVVGWLVGAATAVWAVLTGKVHL